MSGGDVLTVVWGPPCSGKTTYVREHARPGDVVIDLDRIALALTLDGTGHHDYGEEIRYLAQQARRAILRPAALYGLSGKGDAWIIDSNAGPERLAEWRRSGATVVTLDVAYDVCLARAKAERPGTTAVVEWFARHGGRQW